MTDHTPEKTFQTDVAMRLIWQHMLQDLTYFSDVSLVLDLLRHADIPRVRRELESVKTDFSCSPLRYRCLAQALNFCKRYRFANDLLTDEELAESSWQKFRLNQERCSVPFDAGPLYRAGLVSKWRHLCKEILGPYDPSEWERYAKFARKATVGHPSRRRRLDQKLAGHITGSPGHLRTLRGYLEGDQHLQAAIKGSKFKVVTSLKLTFVPKSYKALRAVMPDTLAGSFYNSGVGGVLRSRLKQIGLDIGTLQARHRRLAKHASQPKQGCARKRLATVDLSSASDSVTPQLLRLVLPRSWYTAVMHGRVPYYLYNGNRYRLSSACTMGLGHTFSLQTLLFYVLTKGVAEMTQDGLVSVYGDDIIVPSGAVKALQRVFEHVHLILNGDKSFWGLCDFRESCGEDFYRGIPVRPAMPEKASARLRKREFAAFLYSVGNTIFERWLPEDLPETGRILACMLRAVTGYVRRVPKHFPSTAGIKYDIPGAQMICETRDWVTRVEAQCLVGRKSPIVNEQARLWEWFRTSAFLDFQREVTKVVTPLTRRGLQKLLRETLNVGLSEPDTVFVVIGRGKVRKLVPTRPLRRGEKVLAMATDPGATPLHRTHMNVTLSMA